MQGLLNVVWMVVCGVLPETVTVAQFMTFACRKSAFFPRHSLGGERKTASTGIQLLVFPDQRSGFLCLRPDTPVFGVKKVRVRSAMSVERRHLFESAMAVIILVPPHKGCHPLAGFLQGVEVPIYQIVRTVFHRLEEGFRMRIVIAD